VNRCWLFFLLVALFCTASAEEAPPKGQKLPGSVGVLYKAVNEYRAQNGLPAVKLSGKLILAAMGHSKEMAEKDYFSHHSPTPGQASAWDRAESVGYDWAAVSENIYRTAQSGDEEIARDSMNVWIESDGHRANLLDPTVKDIGVGVAQYSNGEYAVTLMMGREF
jgi:uncharacterized protein YkwD